MDQFQVLKPGKKKKEALREIQQRQVEGRKADTPGRKAWLG